MLRLFTIRALTLVIASSLFLTVCDAAKWRPVVLMHGINNNAAGMDLVKQWIEADFPGIYVKNMEIGNGKEDSIFWGMQKQTDTFAANIRADPNLAQGFNLIGYSQGGMSTQAYIEQYNNPPVYNYITWSSPHGGESGIPEFNVPILDKIVNELVDGSWLNTTLQQHLSIAGYWRDSLNYTAYQRVNQFLAPLNGEVSTPKLASYKANIISLNSMTLLYSEVDKVIIPKSSGWFESYAVGSINKVVPLKQSDLYTQDRIGLKTLDQRGKLFLYTTQCLHGDYPTPKCKSYYDQYTKPMLNNQLP